MTRPWSPNLAQPMESAGSESKLVFPQARRPPVSFAGLDWWRSIGPAGAECRGGDGSSRRHRVRRSDDCRGALDENNYEGGKMVGHVFRTCPFFLVPESRLEAKKALCFRSQTPFHALHRIPPNGGHHGAEAAQMRRLQHAPKSRGASEFVDGAVVALAHRLVSGMESVPALAGPTPGSTGNTEGMKGRSSEILEPSRTAVHSQPAIAKMEFLVLAAADALSGQVCRLPGARGSGFHIRPCRPCRNMNKRHWRRDR